MVPPPPRSHWGLFFFFLISGYVGLRVCLFVQAGVACEETAKEQRPSEVFEGLTGESCGVGGRLVATFGLNTQRSGASSEFYWTLSTSAVKNKGHNRKTLMDHKCPGRAPRRLAGRRGWGSGTHTTLMTTAGPRRSEMRICGRLLCLMSVWDERRGSRGAWRTQESCSVSVNALTHSSSRSKASGPPLSQQDPLKTKTCLFLWWKLQFNVCYSFFLPLFLVKSGVGLAFKPYICSTKFIYLSAHLGTV